MNLVAEISELLEIILKDLKVFNRKVSSKAVYNLMNDNVKLSENQKLILGLLENDRFMTQSDIAQKLKMTTANVNRNIKKLKGLGLLERKGLDKSGYWLVSGR